MTNKVATHTYTHLTNYRLKLKKEDILFAAGKTADRVQNYKANAFLKNFLQYNCLQFP